MFSFNKDKVDWENELGEGNFGRVYPYQKSPGDDKWVVKHVTTRNIQDFLAYVQEIVLGFSCEHPNVLSVEGYHIDYDKVKKDWDIYIKLRRMHGSLKSKILQHHTKNEIIPEDEIAKYFHELCCGLEYLHKKGIAHRDIKPDNVLINQDGHVQIADIGLGKFVGDETSYIFKEVAGTFSYTAPEVLAQRGQNNSHMKKKDLFKADLWSLGVVVIELCMLKQGVVNGYVAGEKNEVDLAEKLKELETKEYKKSFLELISSLLKCNPSERKSLQEIKEGLEQLYPNLLKVIYELDHDLKQLGPNSTRF